MPATTKRYILLPQGQTEEKIDSVVKRYTNSDIVYNETNKVNINTLDTTNLKPQYVKFNTSVDTAPTETGTLYWDTQEKTLSLVMEGGTVKLQVGQEMHDRVTNNTGAQLDNGTVVYISGAQGNKHTVAKADASDKNNSDKVIGMCTEDIADNAQGYITTFGIVRDLDTSAYSEGDLLYLDDTAGQYVDTKPSKGNRCVRIGTVLKSHNTDGWIHVNIHHVSFLDELSDVSVTNVASEQILQYDSANTVWKNVTLPSAVYGEISSLANTTATTLTTQSTWYQFTNFNTEGLSNNVTVSTTESHIEIPATGVYRCHFGVSFSGTANSNIEMELKKNNGTTDISNVHIERKLGAAGDIGTGAQTGIVSLTAGDTLELWARSTSGGGQSITIRDCNFSIEELSNGG